MNTHDYNGLSDFLAKHSAKQSTAANVIPTHTRIPDASLNIYPGKYIIPKEDLPVFYELYCHHVFVKKHNEYLTEKQPEDGPIVVDFDFRYEHSVDTRPHTMLHVTDVVTSYLDELKEFYLFDASTSFPVFIFEKPNVNRLADGSLTKDGIHMLIGIHTQRPVQIMLRNRMLNILPLVLDTLPLQNGWDAVLDEGISRGGTNWPLFGSRKPGNDAYRMTYHFQVTYDTEDGTFIMEQQPVERFNMRRDFATLSVQYDGNARFPMNPRIQAEYDAFVETLKSKKPKKAGSRVRVRLISDMAASSAADEEDGEMTLDKIVDEATLTRAVDLVLKSLRTNEYDIRETHEYTQELPAKYYEPGSHMLNYMVAFALKYTDERLFLSWVQLRSKASDFDYATIPALYQDWRSFHRSNEMGKTVTKRSIMYWLRTDNYEAYDRIRKNTIDHYINQALSSSTEYDFALILHYMYKDNFICTNLKGTWYKFIQHRWVMDPGLTLRTKISKELNDLMTQKSEKVEEELNENAEDNNQRETLKSLLKTIHHVKNKLKSTDFKNKIMRESAEIFYDDNFVKHMDGNIYLLCFNNGVVDFEKKVFRDGCPEDYLTKTTNIDYVAYDESNPVCVDSAKQIHGLMDTLFPTEDLRRYMWDHLASVCIGNNQNQTFHVYFGSGSNGKSLLIDLMSHAFGEYKGTLPLGLLTESRVKIGNHSDEVAKLRGVRYAVSQELTKGAVLNEGTMKEMTGGTDVMQVRGIYRESETFIPQFTPVVSTNTRFEQRSNDDGTWRRMRECPFVSKFVDDGEMYQDDTVHVFKKDKTLTKKIPTLAPVFAGMLVKRAFETNGIVEDCKTVIEATNQYREKQDIVGTFVRKNIYVSTDTRQVLKKMPIFNFFKEYMQTAAPSMRVPKADDLYDVIDKVFKGKFTKAATGWKGLAYRNADEDDVAPADMMDTV